MLRVTRNRLGWAGGNGVSKYDRWLAFVKSISRAKRKPSLTRFNGTSPTADYPELAIRVGCPALLDVALCRLMSQVLHSKDNPLALEAEAAKRETKRQLQVLTEENKRLTQQVRRSNALYQRALVIVEIVCKYAPLPCVYQPSCSVIRFLLPFFFHSDEGTCLRHAPRVLSTPCEKKQVPQYPPSSSERIVGAKQECHAANLFPALTRSRRQ